MSVGVDSNERFAAYTHPEKLVSTEWLAQHLDDPDVVIVESDEDVLLYEVGHIPGALKIDWIADLNDDTIRDYVDAEGFAQLMSEKGIRPDSTVILYGDNNNWWATYALWVFSLFGHEDLRILDGGRDKWEAEGREMTTDKSVVESTDYPTPERDETALRAFLPDARDHAVNRIGPLVDVRSPEEFTGERLHIPGYPNEGAVRGGHIPGAKNVPWKMAANEDGTFKSREELEAIYAEQQGLEPSEDIIVYCRIGER
ncbi:MAG: sulfurtransferase, partial [Acidimicrobiia bacterium]|nr:sulfurtransferase [Acidimicrobiia bacterium]